MILIKKKSLTIIVLLKIIYFSLLINLCHEILNDKTSLLFSIANRNIIFFFEIDKKII